jgi:GNAT superfamily N-acetyltransferase
METVRPGYHDGIYERRAGYKARLLQMVGRGKPTSVEINPSPGLEIRTINIASLIPIMDYAFGSKEWDSRNEGYWKDQEWQFQQPNPKLKNTWTAETRETYFFLKRILKWASDPETRGHLDPPPGIPVYNERGEIIEHRSPDFKNETEVDRAVADLAVYYFNKGEPHKIKPLLAVDVDSKGKENPAGVLTLRWKGDPYVPPGHHKVASIERLLVAPKYREKGISTKLVSTAIEHAFYTHKGYGKEPDKKGAEEIRIWVLTDRKAGNYNINMNLLFSLGLKPMKPPYIQWSEYAKLINEKSDREALLFSLKKEDWETAKQKNPKINPCDIIEASNTREVRL